MSIFEQFDRTISLQTARDESQWAVRYVEQFANEHPWILQIPPVPYAIRCRKTEVA